MKKATPAVFSSPAAALREWARLGRAGVPGKGPVLAGLGRAGVLGKGPVRRVWGGWV
ncbi:MAG: hypothetical protein ACREJU_07845 [Nitrospiraceae bacterium]